MWVFRLRSERAARTIAYNTVSYRLVVTRKEFVRDAGSPVPPTLQVDRCYTRDS